MKLSKLPERLTSIMKKVASDNSSIDLGFVENKTFKMVADEIMIAKINNRLEGK